MIKETYRLLAKSRLNILDTLNETQNNKLIEHINAIDMQVQPLLTCLSNKIYISSQFKYFLMEFSRADQFVNLYEVKDYLSYIMSGADESYSAYYLYIYKMYLECIALSQNIETSTKFEYINVDTHEQYNDIYLTIAYSASRCHYLESSQLYYPEIIVSDEYMNLILTLRAGLEYQSMDNVLNVLGMLCRVFPQAYLVIDYLDRVSKIGDMLYPKGAFQKVMEFTNIKDNLDTVLTNYLGLFNYDIPKGASNEQKLQVYNDNIHKSILGELYHYNENKPVGLSVADGMIDFIVDVIPLKSSLLKPITGTYSNIFKESVTFVTRNFSICSASLKEDIKMGTVKNLRQHIKDSHVEYARNCAINYYKTYKPVLQTTKTI